MEFISLKMVRVAEILKKRGGKINIGRGCDLVKSTDNLDQNGDNIQVKYNMRKIFSRHHLKRKLTGPNHLKG